MTTQLLGKNCDGGYYSCSPPKDCCKQGCCYLATPPFQKPPTVSTANIFSPLFIGHWYFWVAIMATVIGILCACSLWRRHSHGSGATFCCRNSSRDERVSEPDSNGSCYAPPQYSRCNSFHQPPPPYSEVASKPDLYPLVISYNGDSVIKTNHSAGYLMVQYFRNFIVRPVGSLSATSTIESLSSSFICNATNDANIIPPPYSCMGSLEEVTTDERNVETPPPLPIGRLPHSASSLSTEPYHQPVRAAPSPITTPPPLPPPPTVHATPNRHISIRDNPCFGQTAKEETVSSPPETTDVSCNSSPYKRILKPIPKFPKDCSQDSDEDHNFSDLLNLSVCVPSSIANLCTSVQSNHLQELHYSVTDSMTGSDISSLANLGSPDSPPRATSPTLEMKELLDKIQQLPQQKSPVLVEASKSIGRCRVKAKTLYMPLHEKPRNSSKSSKMFSKGWLSRSAPNTPCANFTPTFPIHKKGSSQKGSRSGVGDGSPLLKEHEESEEDANKDETL